MSFCPYQIYFHKSFTKTNYSIGNFVESNFQHLLVYVIAHILSPLDKVSFTFIFYNSWGTNLFFQDVFIFSFHLNAYVYRFSYFLTFNDLCTCTASVILFMNLLKIFLRKVTQFFIFVRLLWAKKLTFCTFQRTLIVNRTRNYLKNIIFTNFENENNFYFYSNWSLIKMFVKYWFISILSFLLNQIRSLFSTEF